MTRPPSRTRLGSVPAKTPPRTTARPTPADLGFARDEALLQLKIGRSAHYYSVAVSVALLLDAFLVLYFQPSLKSISPKALVDLFPVVFPLVGGLYLSGVAFKLKWDASRFFFSETHFLVTLGALGLNGLLTFLFAARLVGFGPTATWNLLPTLYPLVLLGVSVPLVSLALVWTDWSNRKVAAFVAALAPVPIAFALYLPAASQNATASASALATTFFVSAALFQTSGSLLHLISSGTEAHEREVIRGGQDRIRLLAEELQQKDEALEFREQAIIRREADVESSELQVREERQALEQDRNGLAAFEKDARERAGAVAGREQELRALSARADTLQRTTTDRDAALRLREQELAARGQKLSERDRTLAEREGLASRRELETRARESELVQRAEEVRQVESRLEARRQQIERRDAESAHRETTLRARGGVATVASPARDELGRKTRELSQKELEVAGLRARLDEDREMLGRRSQEATAALAAARRTTDELARREQDLAGREAKLRERESEAAQRLEEANLREAQHTEGIQKAELRLREVEEREGQISSRVGEVDRIGHLISGREVTLKEKETHVAQLRGELQRRERDLIEREKTLEAREEQVSVRSLTLDRRFERPVAGVAPAAVGGLNERNRVLELRERQLREREQQIVRREYEAAHAPAAAESTLAASPVRRLPDRLPTGNSRLDDLLVGGFFPKAHVLLVGPAFTGKEVLLYSFIAEGLRRGEPAILVTTSRSPEELAQDIGKVTSQLREYENLGLVTWIDASNPAAAPPGRQPETSRSVVRGPGDHAGILTALVRAAKKAEEAKAGAFRVGFLTLSTCLSQSDEKEAFAFFQNFVGILKPRNALAVYVVEQGTIPDARVEAVQGRIDGSLRFKQERGKTFLSVQGLGDVQTRDWVEVRATGRQLVIGSFALERIR